MKKIKTEKGITLVALIITIVVLLILAAVAIGAVRDSNIIGHAQNAAEGYKTAKGEEENKITDTENLLDKYAPDVNKKVPDELVEYILGIDEKGRDVFGIINPDTNEFQQDPDNEKSTVHKKVKFIYFTEEEILRFYIRYNCDIYKVDISYSENEETGEEEYKTVKDSLILVDDLTGNLGKYVRYANNTWIVLREDSNGVELISANVLGNVTLDESNVNVARASYNKVIETLVEACKIETGITKNIRNVGGPAIDAITMNNTIDFDKIDGWNHEAGVTFEDYEGINNGLKVGDTNYLSDYEQMKKIGILKSDIPADYWLASRYVWTDGFFVDFRVRYIDNSGDLKDEYQRGLISGLLNFKENGDVSAGSLYDSYGVRPVITLESGILDNASQTGFIDDPIILN